MDRDAFCENVKKRRTFAIISHPDAGKTTLTEKLLLYSGMIHTAGMVRGRKGRKAAASDWMGMEQERGISITASAMQFPYKDAIINVLDTPGHQDFSEDTYRTLTAADAAVMVIDAAKGVEPQTRKLFEVCRLRKIPVLTFINKWDLPPKDAFDLMDEVEKILHIQASPLNWPIGEGKEFSGLVDLVANEALFFEKKSVGGALIADIERVSLEKAAPKISESVSNALELLEIAGNPFDKERFLKGEITPVFFGSALTNYGVEPFFDALVELAPFPQKRAATEITTNSDLEIDPLDTSFSAYVFKLQANMDKMHRDSMAFLRICSGILEKDLNVYHERLGRSIRLSRPHTMMAGERDTVEYAFPGDVVGVINPGLFRLGDTVSISKNIRFKPLPQFQPEIFAKITPKDIGKRKTFDKAIKQFVEEGTVQKFIPIEHGSDPVYAAVGQLQFEVVQYRFEDEYKIGVHFEYLPHTSSGWLEGDLTTFRPTSSTKIVRDEQGNPLVLFSASWEKDYARQLNPNHQILDMRQ